MKLDHEEYYDICAIGLCKAAKTMNEKRGRFSTHAYKCMDNEVKGYLREQNSEFRKTQKMSVSMFIETEDDGSQLEVDFCDKKIFENDSIFDLVIKDKLRTLTLQEQVVVNKFLDGYTPREIADELGYTTQNIYQIKKQLQNKFLDIYGDQLKHL